MKSKISIGADIIEISRFRNKPIKKYRRFYDSIFTKLELEHCQKYSDVYPHLAGIFAAKEAIIKCIEKPLRMNNIEIFWHKSGKPIVNINSERIKVYVSVSHTKSLAIAIALIL